MTSHEDAVAAVARQWLSWDECEETRAEVVALLAQAQWAALDARMTPRLTFGTAGLRAPMGAGFARMNALVVVQTAQGVAAQVRGAVDDAHQRGIVVGHDHRHQSDLFARLIAGVLLHDGYAVHVVGPGVCATPLVPFHVKRLNAAAGIMITASHNPKDDNGLKLYGANAAQIVPPTDAHVQDAILAHLQPQHWDATAVDRLAHHVNDAADAYIAAMRANLRFDRIPPASQPVVYTAMHGVGHAFVCKAFEAFGLDLPEPVVQQVQPDPDFPTVKFPNPEEGRGALAMAMQLAERISAPLILANDPDADRLAVAERTQGWKIFNGNELGVLLGSFMLQQCQLERQSQQHHTGHQPLAMLASAVSSKMLGAICAKAEPPVLFKETLTGFKWLGNEAIQLEAAGYRVVFAYEEAIGFMADPTIKDKDGISAAVAITVMWRQLRERGSTLVEALEQLYTSVGYFANNNSYFICNDPKRTLAIFDRVRHFDGGDAFVYPTACGPFTIRAVRDVTRGFDSETVVSPLPIDQTSQFIALRFENGATVSLRASGTEPKIKYYAEMRGDLADRTQTEQTLQAVVDAVVEDLLQPVLNGLVPRST